MARYAGQILSPAEGFSLWPRLLSSSSPPMFSSNHSNLTKIYFMSGKSPLISCKFLWRVVSLLSWKSAELEQGGFPERHGRSRTKLLCLIMDIFSFTVVKVCKAGCCPCLPPAHTVISHWSWPSQLWPHSRRKANWRASQEWKKGQEKSRKQRKRTWTKQKRTKKKKRNGLKWAADRQSCTTGAATLAKGSMPGTQWKQLQRDFPQLADTRRYGPLRGPTSSSCGGLRLFCPSGKKRAYYAALAHFWHVLVSNSNLGNF